MPDKERVHVHCRMRPVIQRPKDQAAAADVFLTGQSEVPSNFGKCDPLNGTLEFSKDGENMKAYKFDSYFSPKSSQSDVYQRVGAGIVQDVLKGYNGTILAYGQTGTGKTFTMLGPQEPEPEPQQLQEYKDENGDFMAEAIAKAVPTFEMAPEKRGVIPRALDEIFHHASADPDYVYDISVSYVQIYCELITDLLEPKSTSRSLAVREDPDKGVYIEGAATYKVNNTVECLQYLQEGQRNRVTASTMLNSHSSRSHTVFLVHVAKRPNSASVGGGEEVHMTRGTLYLVDLAGSERAKKSGVAGVRMSELKSINLSLSALGNCIAALASRKSHVPYRDSRLTRLLQDSLGGNAKTSLIITVCDESESAHETKSTLEFGSRARKVEVSATVNRILDYKAMYQALQAKLDSGSDETTSLKITIQKLQGEVQRLKDRLDTAEHDRKSAEAALLGASSQHSVAAEAVKALGIAGEAGEKIDAAKLVEEINTRWQTELEKLRKDYDGEIEQLKKRHQNELLAQQKITEEACEKLNELEYKYSSSRDELLAAMRKYNEIHGRMHDTEAETSSRMGELVSEVEVSRRELEEKDEEILALTQKLQGAEGAMKQAMNRIKNDFVSRKQVEEMQNLYEEAINKLQHRVEVLENKKRGSKASFAMVDEQPSSSSLLNSTPYAAGNPERRSSRSSQRSSRRPMFEPIPGATSPPRGNHDSDTPNIRSAAASAAATAVRGARESQQQTTQRLTVPQLRVNIGASPLRSSSRPEDDLLNSISQLDSVDSVDSVLGVPRKKGSARYGSAQKSSRQRSVEARSSRPEKSSRSRSSGVRRNGGKPRQPPESPSARAMRAKAAAASHGTAAHTTPVPAPKASSSASMLSGILGSDGTAAGGGSHTINSLASARSLLDSIVGGRVVSSRGEANGSRGSAASSMSEGAAGSGAPVGSVAWQGGGDARSKGPQPRGRVARDRKPRRESGLGRVRALGADFQKFKASLQFG